MWTLILVLTTVAAMSLAGHMAGTRRRSVRAWVWISFVVGPLGPLLLYLLGHRSQRAG